MAFEKLPLEINELIASFLTDDNDLCCFTLLCHVTHDAVHSHHCTVWRDRFDATFDLPPGKKGFALKKEYQIRQKVLCRGFTGQSFIHVIHVLRNLIVGTWKSQPLTAPLPRPLNWTFGIEIGIADLILYSIQESFANDRQDPSGKPVSYNLRHLHGIVRRSRLFDYDIRSIRTPPNIDPAVLVFRLLCSHLAIETAANLSPPLNNCTENTLFVDFVLRALFCERKNIFSILLLLHIVDFFKKYLKSETTPEISRKFKNLAEDEKPNIWQQPLKHGTGKLGRSWKGTYGGLWNPFYWNPISYASIFCLAYLDYTSIMHTRRSMMSERDMKPSFDYGEEFKTLELDFAPAECVPWPQVFEDHLHSIPQLGFKVEEGRDFLPFIGTGIDAQPFRCSGIVHALPEVRGIPGWQRITFMKYFTGADPASLTDPSYPPFYNLQEDSPHWAYEGVVLPGGHMMLGRWWNPMERSENMKCTGPFIFWNVPNREWEQDWAMILLLNCGTCEGGESQANSRLINLLRMLIQIYVCHATVNSLSAPKILPQAVRPNNSSRVMS